ncbi:MAG TPA: hypothetical protein VNL35_06265 [Chloroflexota bacterium]|nr:hypothetical protein [Chloroflexota bacterium]
MFSDEAIEAMVWDSFNELCTDQGIEGIWADEGPMGLALIPDPLRLGAAVDLWMRVENREENARRPVVERTTIFGSHHIETLDEEPEEEEATDEDGAEADGEVAADEEEQESEEPLLDELELRGRLLVDVMNVVSQQLSNRRGALELEEEVGDLTQVKDEMIEAINLAFSDPRLSYLWANGAFLQTEE